MKAKILASSFALWLIGCGTNAPTNSTPELADEVQNVNSCENLFGKHYLGREGQGGRPVEGCEGCGNPGAIIFSEATIAEVNLPGSDVVELCRYEPSESRVEIFCQDETISLRFSRNCSTLSGNGATYINER